MNREIDTQPDLIAESPAVTMRVWSLEKRVKLPPQFASPELCIVTFPDEPDVCKIVQLVTPDRGVDLTFACRNSGVLSASFYDYDGEFRAPEPEESLAVNEIARAVADIMYSLGAKGTLYVNGA